MADNFSNESAKLLLGVTDSGDVFYVRFLFLNIKLSIPYQSANQIVKISRQVAKMVEPNVDGDMFSEMMRTADNLKYKCRAIAIATGSKIPFLSYLIGRGENKDIYTLLKIVESKSDPESFFLSTKLAKGLNKLKLKENSEALKPSSGD